MDCYVCWRVDGIDSDLGTAFALSNAPELTKLSQLLNKASKDMAEFAMSVFGHVILDGVWAGLYCIPGDKLTELAGVRDRYQSFVGKKISMGIGLEICEASEALSHSIQEGGDRLTFWTQELQDEPQEDEEQHDSLRGLLDDDISKAEKPKEASPSESSASPQQEEPQPDPQQSAAAAPAAGDQPSPTDQSAGPPQQAEQPPQDPRAQIIEALKELKASAPAIEALKERNPQAYQAIKGTVDAMIMMSQSVMQKSEKKKVKKEELSPSETPDEDSSTLDKDELAANRGMPAGLPAAGAVGGTVKNGKIKDTPIEPATTAAQPTKWHSVRSGMVTSNKSGAAISSRRQGDQ